MAQVITVGETVDVKKSKQVPLSFTGTVEKLYANAALLTIDSFNKADKEVVDDLKSRTVVNYKDIKKDGQAVEPPAPEEPTGRNNRSSKTTKK